MEQENKIPRIYRHTYVYADVVSRFACTQVRRSSPVSMHPTRSDRDFPSHALLYVPVCPSVRLSPNTHAPQYFFGFGEVKIFLDTSDSIRFASVSVSISPEHRSRSFRTCAESNTKTGQWIHVNMNKMNAEINAVCVRARPPACSIR